MVAHHVWDVVIPSSSLGCLTISYGGPIVQREDARLAVSKSGFESPSVHHEQCALGQESP